jgi:YegS/Rv2252/BmrU family lipid kinase
VTASTACFIVNPVAGQQDVGQVQAAVLAVLDDADVEVDLRLTQGEGDARAWAAAATEDGADLVIVAGGDGTVREAVSGVVDAGGTTPLGVVPTGTANLLASALGIPKNAPSEAARVALVGAGRDLDVLHVVDRDEHATLMVDAGFDARLVRDADRGRKDVLGHVAYVLAGVRNLFTLRRVGVHLELDGETVQRSAHSVLAVNIGQVGQNVEVAPGIEPDDGLLHVGVLTQAMPWLACTAVGMILLDRDAHPDVDWATCRRLRVETDEPLPVQIDGEAAGTTPVEVELLPAAATLRVPSEA